MYQGEDGPLIHQIKPNLENSHYTMDMIRAKRLTNAAQMESVAEVQEDKPRAKNVYMSEKEILGKGKVHVMNTKGTVTGVTSRVQLFVSAKNLADLDLITQSDPFCQLKVKNTKNGSYI